jgi:hypothetical protein
MNAYLFSRQLVEAAEHRILRAHKAPWHVGSWLRREFLHPLFFVTSGMEFLFQNWMKMVIYPALFAVFLGYVARQMGISPDQISVLTTLGILMGFLIVLFSMPSSYVHTGISDEDVIALAERIESQVFCESELGSIRANLEILEEGAKDRVKALSWTLGTAWAAAMLGYNQFMGISARLADSNQIGELLGGSLTFFAVAGFLALVSLLAITGYRRANVMVFRGLKFACNQVSISLCAQAR